MTKAEEFFNVLTTEIPDVKPGKMFALTSSAYVSSLKNNGPGRKQT